jgi:hypothetical protein
MTAQVFDKEYPRYDLAFYVSVAFSGWLSLGAGALGEFRQDMKYRNVGPGLNDTTTYVLKGSTNLGLFFIVGAKYDIPLSQTIFVPIGAYFNNFKFLNPIPRIGLTMRF